MKRKWKKKSERKDRKQCVYQQTFGCCQLTGRALGYQRKKTELYNQAVKAGREGVRDRQTETENKTGTGKKHCHLKWQGQHYQRKNKHGTHTHTETEAGECPKSRNLWWVKIQPPHRREHRSEVITFIMHALSRHRVLCKQRLHALRAHCCLSTSAFRRFFGIPPALKKRLPDCPTNQHHKPVPTKATNSLKKSFHPQPMTTISFAPHFHLSGLP